MRLLPAAALALVLSSAAAFADLVITQKVEGAGQTGDVVLKIKDNRVRADLPQGVSSITDTATGESVTLMHPQRSYLKISGERSKELLQRMQEQVHGAPASAEPAKLEPTGKKEKIGDWEAEVFTSKIGKVTITYWIAKDFPNYAAIAPALQKIQLASLGNLGPKTEDLGGMPVKIEMTFDKRKITNTVLSVKEQAVDEGVFALPKNYKEIELPAGQP